MSTLNDLLPALQRRDHEAWKTLYLMCGPSMFAYAFKLTGHTKDAEDLSHAAYLAMWQNGLKNCSYLTQGYWSKVILHEYLTLRRIKKGRKEISFEQLGGKNDGGKPQPYDPEDPKQPDVKEELEFKEFIKRLMEILEDLGSDKITLTPEQSEAFRLRYIDGLSLDEIAEIQDVPKDTVKKRIIAARYKLFSILKSYDDL